MIPYKDIPQEIKESYEVNSLRRLAPTWSGRKILSEYMDCCTRGIKTIITKQQTQNDYVPTGNQLLLVSTYYILRKEFFKRMSPLVSKRSDDVIMMDNKKLLDKFDTCLLSGTEYNIKKARRYMEEICSRMENDISPDSRAKPHKAD